MRVSLSGADSGSLLGYRAPLLSGDIGVATAFANANGLLSGHPYMAYWFYAGAGAMLLVAIYGWIRSRF
jgi:hypothetical protein